MTYDEQLALKAKLEKIIGEEIIHHIQAPYDTLLEKVLNALKPQPATEPIKEDIQNVNEPTTEPTEPTEPTDAPANDAAEPTAAATTNYADIATTDRWAESAN